MIDPLAGALIDQGGSHTSAVIIAMTNEREPGLGWDMTTAVFDTLHPEINPVRIGFTHSVAFG